MGPPSWNTLAWVAFMAWFSVLHFRMFFRFKRQAEFEHSRAETLSRQLTTLEESVTGRINAGKLELKLDMLRRVDMVRNSVNSFAELAINMAKCDLLEREANAVATVFNLASSKFGDQNDSFHQDSLKAPNNMTEAKNVEHAKCLYFYGSYMESVQWSRIDCQSELIKKYRNSLPGFHKTDLNQLTQDLRNHGDWLHRHGSELRDELERQVTGVKNLQISA